MLIEKTAPLGSASVALRPAPVGAGGARTRPPSSPAVADAALGADAAMIALKTMFDPAALATVLWHGRPVPDLRVEGAVDSLERCVTLFRPAT